MNAPITALLAAILASGLTAVLIPALSPQDGSTSSEAATSGSAAMAATPGGSVASDASAELAANAALSQIEDLKMEVASLRSSIESFTARRASTLDQQGLADAREAAALMPDEASRTLILDVLAQKEEDDQRQRELERQQRREERMLEQADKIAAELGLNRADRDALHSVMVEESARREALFTSMRENGFGDRETVRAEMQVINEWKEGELSSRFGEDLAGQIDEMDGNGGFGRGGRGGGDTGGGRGGGGRGGL